MIDYSLQYCHNSPVKPITPPPPPPVPPHAAPCRSVPLCPDPGGCAYSCHVGIPAPPLLPPPPATSHLHSTKRRPVGHNLPCWGPCCNT